MLFKKGLIITSFLLLLVLAIGFVSATQDLNTTDSEPILNTADDKQEVGIDENSILTNAQDDVKEQSLNNDANNAISSVLKDKDVKSASPKTFATIQKKIDSAKKGSVIKLSGKYTGSGKAIKIDNSITIQGTGKGATLDAKKLSRIFYIAKNTKVTLKNLNLRNALSKSSGGGAIYSKASNLNVYNCNFRNNGADEAGDMYIASGQCNVKISTFSQAYPYSHYGDDHYYDGWYAPPIASIINKGETTFHKCSFTNMYNVLQSSGKVTFTNCNFKNNGGGVMMLEGTNTIKNCKFIKNAAGEHVDAYPDMIIEVSQGKTSIIKSKFIDNTDEVIEVMDGATCKIINCKFTKNYSKNYYGYHYGSVDVDFNGKLYVTKNKKTVKYTDIWLGDLLKPIPYATAPKFTSTYNSGKILKIRYFDGGYDKKYNVLLKVFTGKKYKVFKSKMLKNGISKFKITGVGAGTHKYKFFVRLYEEHDGYSKEDYYVKYTGKLKITPAKTIIKAPKVTFKAKTKNYFKITVKNKSNKKLINGIKVNVKVFTGNKYKKYTVKTKKGAININTKNLKKGLHKVTIESANSNYKISAKSSIKII